MKTSLLTLSAAALLLSACSSHVYNNKSYVKQHDLTGKRIAILPVEVEYTGRIPKGYSAEKIREEEEDESLAIQSQVYSEYLYHAPKKKSGAVELMNVEQVNSSLRSHGIDPRQSWAMNPDSLGRITGADLVLKVRVKKNRIMSETAALGVDVAGAVIDRILTKNNTTNNGLGVDPGRAKTYTIHVSATLSDANTHEVVTRFQREGDAHWNKSPEAVVRTTGKKIVKKGVVYASR